MLNVKNEKLLILKGGFNTSMLADALKISVNHLNELKRLPSQNIVVDTIVEDLGVDDMETVEKLTKAVEKAFNAINIEAIEKWIEDKKINVDEIDLKAIVDAKQVKVERQEYKQGDITPLGKIITIKKLGNNWLYVVDKNGKIDYYTKQDLYKAEREFNEKATKENEQK